MKSRSSAGMETRTSAPDCPKRAWRWEWNSVPARSGQPTADPPQQKAFALCCVAVELAALTPGVQIRLCCCCFACWLVLGVRFSSLACWTGRQASEVTPRRIITPCMCRGMRREQGLTTPTTARSRATIPPSATPAAVPLTFLLPLLLPYAIQQQRAWRRGSWALLATSAGHTHTHHG